MSRKLILNGSFALAAVVVLLTSGPRPARAIDGGLEDTGDPPVHPNACAVIGVPEEGSGSPLRMASGVLIHPRVVLTGGHVTDWFATIWDVPPDRTRISFAGNAFDEPQWLEVSDYITHPLYNGYFGAEGHADVHDLGVVILKEPVAGITPATLPTEGLLDAMKAEGALQFGAEHGTEFTVVGYGWGFSFPPPTPLRDERGIRRYGPTICMGMTHAALHFLQYPDGVVTQNGDSGGPTFWETDSGDRILVAVTAWGSPGLGVDHRYRIDTEDSLFFIDCVLAAVETDLL